MHIEDDDLTTWSDAALAALLNWRGYVSPPLARLMHAACIEIGRRIQEAMQEVVDAKP